MALSYLRRCEHLATRVRSTAPTSGYWSNTSGFIVSLLTLHPFGANEALGAALTQRGLRTRTSTSDPVTRSRKG